MNKSNTTRRHADLTPLTDAQMRRSTYTAILLGLFLPPAMGSTLMGLVGYYPFPEVYRIFLSYTGPYVLAITILALSLAPRAVRFVTGIATMDHDVAQVHAQHAFTRLPWFMLGAVAIYSILGAYSADMSIEAMGYRDYTLRDHLYNQFGLIPVVLITTFPIFFYYIDCLGRYLGPRGITVTAIPLWLKLLTLGIVTPLLIDSLLIGYFLNRTGYFVWETAALWVSLLALAAGGTWLVWRSLRQGITPLQAFLTARGGLLSDRARTSLAPLSLDEFGTLTARYAGLLGEQLRAETLANAVIEHAGALVMVRDREGHIRRFNNACEHLSGYSFAEVEGKSLREISLLPEDTENTREGGFASSTDDAQLKSGQHTNCWLNRSGQQYLIEWSNTVLPDTAGDMEFVVSIGIDITERQKTQELLLLKNAAMEHALNAIALADLTGRLTYVNPAFLKLWGYERADDVLGRPATGFWKDPAEAEAVIVQLQTYGRWHGVMEARHASGRILAVEMATILIHDPSGQPVQMYGSFQDITDRKRTEERILQSESWLRHAQTVANVGAWELDLATDHLKWSDETARIFGRDPDLYGNNYDMFINGVHPDDRDAVNRTYREAVDNHIIYDIRHRVVRPDGTLRWVHERGETVYDSWGKAVRTVGAVQDITDLAHSEEALRTANQIMSAVLDTTPVLIAYLDTDMNFVRVNRAYAAADNKDPNYFVGKNHFLLYPNPENETAFRRVVETGETLTANAKPFEYEHNPDRGVSHWDWTLTPIKDAQGKVTGLVLSLTNVSDRIAALEAMERSKQALKVANESLESRVRERTAQMRAAQRIARLGHWEWNIATDTIVWSEETFRIFGFQPGQITPTLALHETRIHPDDLAMIQKFIRDTLAGGAHSGTDYRILHEDGNIRWVHGETMVTRDDSGKPLVVSGTVHDITERKQDEATLREAKDNAERANRAKSEFLSRMSHELRTPMNAILGFAQVLELDKLGPEQLEYVHEIHRAGDHLLELINELLDLSRIEAGKMVVVMQPASLKTMLELAIQLVQGLMDEHRITLTNLCGEHIQILADPTRLKQILVNLLSNAIKYNRRGGHIAIDCKPMAGSHVQVRITDTGPGIDPGKLDSLFTPFERLGAEKTAIEGTGIGLAISRQLAESMNMKLGVRSVPGQGSTFWIEAPLAAPGELDALPEATMSPKPAESGQITVLYIEDNAANLRVVEAMFRLQPKLRLLSATNGEYGLELARLYHPDVILLDIHLPEMDGYAVLQHLQADSATCDIPVIALSADAMPIDIERGTKAGFADYLTKPVKADSLLKAMMNAVDNGIQGKRSIQPG